MITVRNGTLGSAMTFTSYAAQRSLDGSRSAVAAKRSRSPALAGLQGEDYLMALRSSPAYMAMLREQWAQENDVQLDVASKWWKPQVEEPAPVLRSSPTPFSPEAQADKFAALPIGGAEDAKLRERVILRHPACTGWFTHVYQSRNALLGIQAANQSAYFAHYPL